MLVAWYPTLTRRHETIIHKTCVERVGEFHPLAALPDVLSCADRFGAQSPVSTTDMNEAQNWARSKRDENAASA